MSGSFDIFLSGNALLIACWGTLLGIVVGAIPGLTGAMLISLSVPLTYTMGPENALVLLVGMYVGAVSGGLISATILRMPGTPASVMTTLDGYPMALAGRPRRALLLGVGASLIGGLLSWGFLVFLAKPAAAFSTVVGYWETFSLVFMTICLTASLGQGSPARALLAGFLGILLALPGPSPATGIPRFTFGFVEMADGFKPLPVLIGLFAICQVIRMVAPSDSGPQIFTDSANRRSGLRLVDWLRQKFNLVRSSVIGTLIGILPGVGANVGSALSYGAARGLSDEPEKYGTGCDDGIVASEAANNATVGGALVPLIGLGIPGSVIDVILLGAFVMHGLQPGPLLFENHPETVHAITGAYLVANLAMAAIMIAAAPWLARLASIPRWILLPSIVVFSVIGSYAEAHRIFDVWVVFLFGGIGLILERYRMPLAPFAIGFVLAHLAEENLCAGLMQSGGSWWPIFSRPISLAFTLAGICLLFLPVFLSLRTRKQVS